MKQKNHNRVYKKKDTFLWFLDYLGEKKILPGLRYKQKIQNLHAHFFRTRYI